LTRFDAGLLITADNNLYTSPKIGDTDRQSGGGLLASAKSPSQRANVAGAKFGTEFVGIGTWSRRLQFQFRRGTNRKSTTSGGGDQQRRDKADAFHLGLVRIHRLTALKGNGVMMRLDDGPAATRGGTKLMLGPERIRRMLDFLAAATGLILLAPIFLVTAIAINLDSEGPIFVREPMFGHGNRRIQLLKFRLVSGHKKKRYLRPPNTTWPNSV
jgi:hypothetical protein